MSIEASMKEHALAVRNRLWNSAVRPRIAPAPRPVPTIAYVVSSRLSFIPPRVWVPSDSWRNIVKQAAIKHLVSIAEIMGEGRGKKAVLARHECFYRCSKELGMSLEHIGTRLNRDHTTVLSGIRKHAERMTQ